MTTLETVKKCIIALSNGPEKVNDDDEWITDLALDSLDWAELITDLATLLPINPEKLDHYVAGKLYRANATRLFMLTPKTLAAAIDAQMQ